MIFLFLVFSAHAAVSSSWWLPAGTDQAAVERLKIKAKDLARVEAADLATLSQEQLDQLYFRLQSGPFPQGDYRGTVLVKNDLTVAIEEQLLKIMAKPGTFTGFFANAAVKKMCGTQDRVKCAGEFLWSGKRFYPPRADGAVELRNAIAPFRAEAALALLGFPLLVAEFRKAKQEPFNGSNRAMIFPANVYCGLSFIDARRESIILDAAYGDDFSGSGGRPYIPAIDSLVGRNGAALRDEIRMVHPGLYLGRGYTEKVFVLNFVLESLQDAAPAPSKCWAGDSWN